LYTKNILFNFPKNLLYDFLVHKNNKMNDLRFLKAVDITPKDDAFHGNINLLDAEWWYFDAIFDNGYSIHIGIRTYHIRNFGIVQTRINVYKKGAVITEELKTNFFSNFSTSKEKPYARINEDNILEFDEEFYKKTKQWKYKIKLKMNDAEIDLIFIGTSKGWKIETDDNSWVVPIPKAKVTGTVNFDGQIMNVKGVGYHDHNWDYTPKTAFKNIGWFWGRIMGDSLNLTWANILHTNEFVDLIAVLNSDETGDFYNISPENFNFVYDNFEKTNKKLIPKIFKIKINDDNNKSNKILIDLDLETIGIQHTKIAVFNYWRYHIKTNGKMKIGSKSEYIKNKSQIIEFLCFKSRLSH